MKKEIKSGIYCIRNIINNKVYIGSAVDLLKRKKEHFNRLNNNKHENSHLQRAFNKYGEGSFLFEVLTYVEDKEKLTNIETLYIQLFKCHKGDIGYNICSIGGSSLGVKHSEETKLKMSQSKKGKYDGDNNPFYGKKHTEDTLIQLRLPKTNEQKQKIFEASTLKKTLVQLTIDNEFVKEFLSIREAERNTNIYHQSITRVCQGKQKTAGGFKWMYLEDYRKKVA